MIIIVQDFKYRAVHLLALLGVFMVSTGILFFKTDTFFNLQTLVYTTTIFTLMWLYVSLKGKTFVNPLKEHIGLGDILFLFAISPLFTVYNFILFFVSGLLVTLLVTLTLKKIIEKKSVPLAGILAGFLVLTHFSTLFMDIDFLSTNFLLISR